MGKMLLLLLLQILLSVIAEVWEIFIAIQGYALLCVGFPTSDVEVETQDEDEVMSKTTIPICTL